MRKLYSLSILLCFSVLQPTFSQNNVSVDPLTGRVQLSIPIGQLSDGNIGVPITVNYNSGGVRVEQGEGSAGMSWQLNAGGQVSRQLRGLPDDYTDGITNGVRGWLYDGLASTMTNFTPTADTNFADCSDEGTDFSFFDGLNFKKDTEPDIYSFNAPGLNGQFIFTASGTPKLINYADLKIEVTRPEGEAITEFKITNNLGIVYKFSRKEDVTRTAFLPESSANVTHFKREFNQYTTPITYTSQWFLTQISSPSGGVINLGYEDAEQVSASEKISIISDTTEQTLYYLRTVVSASQLSYINTTAFNASFDWEENRISSVVIQNNYGSNAKQFDFHYMHASDESASGFSASRAFLESIVQVEECASFPAYTFTYNSTSPGTTILPFGSTTKQDYWGFYNGTATTKFPDIYLYNSQSGAEKYRIHPIPGQTPSDTLKGGGRAANSTYAAVGSLNFVKFPSGAIASIVYESNTYFDEVADTSFIGGGSRVKKVIVSGVEKGSTTITTEYEYNLPNNESSGKLLYRPVFAFNDGNEIIRTVNNLAPDAGILYTRFTTKQTGKGKTVYQFSVPATYPTTSHSTDWLASYSRLARQPGSPCPGISLEGGYWIFPFAPNYSYDFERGLTDRVIDYAENGTVVREQVFKNDRHYDNYSSINGLYYDKVLDSYAYGKYKIYTGVANLTTVDTLRIADELTPSNLMQTITNYKYHSTPGLIDSMFVTNSDGVTYSTRYRYAKDFSSLSNPSSGSPESIAIKTLNDDFRHGESVEIYQSRKEGSSYMVIGSNLTLFKDFSGKTLPYKSLTFPPSSGYTMATVTGSPQVFTYSSSYIPTGIIESVTSKGGARSVKDNKKNKSGILYGFGETLPLASIKNALAEECVYDGFESPAFSWSGGISGLVTGWTGENARSMTSATVLRRDEISKGANEYLFSCWVKATSSAQITFRAMNGTSTISSNSVTYSTSNQWQYVEGILDMSSVGLTFSLEVSANTTVELDDIRFYPSNASMSVTSIKPLVGTTSSSDDRGVSVFKDYDDLGRLQFIKDRNKNIIEVDEYRYKNAPVTPLSSNFTDDRPSQVMAGSQLTFAAPSNCNGATYAWKVNGTSVSTSSSLIHTFSQFGLNEVALTVSSTEGSVTSISDVCVEPAANGDITLEEENEDTDVSQCGPYDRTVVMNLPSGGFGCDQLTNRIYIWSYLVQGGTYTQFATTSGHNNSVIINISSYVNPEQYTWFNVKCELQSTCILYKEENKSICSGDYQLLDENILTFTLYDEDCQ